MRPVAPIFRGQRGYSLVELSIAVVIALFLLGGLFAILQSTRKTSTNQTLLAQLQDNERIAMILLQETVQNAGYYSNPLAQNAIAAFPSSTAFSQAGQTIIGGPTSITDGIGDTLTVRYQPESTGSVLGCLGTQDTPLNQSHEYQLFVKYDDASHKTSSLYCTKDGNGGTPVTAALVPNVNGMTIAYGVDTAGIGSVNTYISGSNMTAANWVSVYSVSITLSFVNPLAGQPGQSNNSLNFTRVIKLMGK
jgi:type IV pilus assembly protein PilW